MSVNSMFYCHSRRLTDSLSRVKLMCLHHSLGIWLIMCFFPPIDCLLTTQQHHGPSSVLCDIFQVSVSVFSFKNIHIQSFKKHYPDFGPPPLWTYWVIWAVGPILLTRVHLNNSCVFKAVIFLFSSCKWTASNQLKRCVLLSECHLKRRRGRSRYEGS